MVVRARAVTLTNYDVVARHVGLDPDAMLGRSGLTISMRDPEQWISAGRVLNLLEDSAARSHRDDFGVLLGECRSFASLGPLSLLLRHEKNLHEIINSMIEYRWLLNDLLQLSVQEHGGTIILEWNLIPRLYSAQGISLVASVTHRVLTEGSGCGFTPECVHFRQAKPHHVTTFKRVFGQSLEFDSIVEGLSFNSVWLDKPNAFADPELAAHARRLLNLLPSLRPEESIAERTRSIIPMIIANGQISLDDVARSQGMTGRTLQRRLICEGQSFSKLLKETRRELAVRYLSQSKQSVTSVAQLIGYSDLSSFTRWFVSEFGLSPVAWRRRSSKNHGRLLEL